MKVLWLDPGGRTGWASFRATVMPGTPVEYYDIQWKAGQLNNPDHHAELAFFLEMEHTDQDTLYGYERFDFRKDKERDKIVYASAEYIGVIKLIAAQRKIPLVHSGAADMKFSDDRKLRALGVYDLVKGQKDAKAAMRHLVRYMVCNVRVPQLLRQLETLR